MALGAASGFFYTGAAVVVGLFAISLVTILRRPYADTFHSIRSALNSFIGFIIFVLYTIAAWKGPTDGSTFSSRGPLVIIVLLLFVVGMALVFVIKQAKADIKNYI